MRTNEAAILVIIILACVGAYFYFHATASESSHPLMSASVGTTTSSIASSSASSSPSRPIPPSTPPPLPTESSGTLVGSVTLSPTCPVERIPPDPQCAPKPYVTKIDITRAGTSNIVAAGESASDGSFTFALPPGTYNVQAQGGTVYPRCSPITAHITSHATTTISISCDTGIR